MFRSVATRQGVVVPNEETRAQHSPCEARSTFHGNPPSPLRASVPSRVYRTGATEAANIVQSSDFQASIMPQMQHTISSRECVTQLLWFHQLDKVYALFSLECASFMTKLVLVTMSALR